MNIKWMVQLLKDIVVIQNFAIIVSSSYLTLLFTAIVSNKISLSESLTDLAETANIEVESIFEVSSGMVALYLNYSSARNFLL